MTLNRRPPQRRYRNARGRRPQERNLLLLLIAIALVVSLVVWRVSPPSKTEPTASILISSPAATTTATARRTTTASGPTAVPRVNALEPLLGPTLDTIIARYATQGITHIGVVIEDDRTGDVVQRNADDPFAAASLYKLFVLWRTQVEIRQGRLADDTPLPLTAANDDSAEDGYSLGAYGDTVTVSDLRRLMITASSNTAAQVLAQWFGLGTINQLLRANGFTATDVVGPPRTTPREVTRFLAGIIRHDLDPLLTTDDYDEMLSLLREQEVNTKLSTGFPDGTVFAHKTGDITGSHHDAGIVYLPDGRPVTITVMTEGDYDASLRLDRDIADLVWRSLAT